MLRHTQKKAPCPPRLTYWAKIYSLETCCGANSRVRSNCSMLKTSERHEASTLLRPDVLVVEC